MTQRWAEEYFKERINASRFSQTPVIPYALDNFKDQEDDFFHKCNRR